MKFARKKNAPSIQDPKHAYGYEELANGELVPQDPPERDPTLGPAFYNTVIRKPRRLMKLFLNFLLFSKGSHYSSVPLQRSKFFKIFFEKIRHRT